MITSEKIRYRSLVIEDLLIAPGFTTVIGANGSGKTTLLKLIAGIVLPESGTILVDGMPPRDIEIGWVNEFPDRNILFGSVFEEIASPLRFRYLPCSEIEKQVASCMESIGINHLGTRPMQELSGGEKVLVAVAAALISRPHVLVLDEYDSHLDINHARKVVQIIRKSGTPYVISCTQDTENAALADRVIFLDSGKIRYTGTPDEVFVSLAGTPYYPISWMCRP